MPSDCDLCILQVNLHFLFNRTLKLDNSTWELYGAIFDAPKVIFIAPIEHGVSKEISEHVYIVRGDLFLGGLVPPATRDTTYKRRWDSMGYFLYHAINNVSDIQFTVY